MFDFRLHVFNTVAKKLNFSKASEELFISQPAVSKHIQELEHHFKIKLFERHGNTISLTNAGKTLLKHTEKIIEFYRKLEFDMNLLMYLVSFNWRSIIFSGIPSSNNLFFFERFLA